MDGGPQKAAAREERLYTACRRGLMSTTLKGQKIQRLPDPGDLGLEHWESSHLQLYTADHLSSLNASMLPLVAR